MLLQARQAPKPQVVKSKVAEVVRRMLGDSITEDQPLMEAGLDSLGAVELRSSLAIAFGLDLPATLTFDYPSIAALTRFLNAQSSSFTAPEPQVDSAQPLNLHLIVPTVSIESI